MLAKFHKDRSTFAEMAAVEKPVLGHNRARPCQCMGMADNKF